MDSIFLDHVGITFELYVHYFLEMCVCCKGTYLVRIVYVYDNSLHGIAPEALRGYYLGLKTFIIVYLLL